MVAIKLNSSPNLIRAWNLYFAAQTAFDRGGAPLPPPVKWAMRLAADVMRQTASRI
jgi:hypothetical protein